MKKRVFSAVLACLLVLALFPTSAFAAEAQEVIYFEDGSYAVVAVSNDEGGMLTRASGSVTGKKEYKRYSSTGTLMWNAVLNATFSYTGSSATCTRVNSFNVTIYDSDWSVGSKSTSRSGSTAYGDLTMTLKIIGGTQGFPVTVTLSCDKDGNLS